MTVYIEHVLPRQNNVIINIVITIIIIIIIIIIAGIFIYVSK